MRKLTDDRRRLEPSKPAEERCRDGCDDHSAERAPGQLPPTPRPLFDPRRHLAIEAPAWTVSLSDAAGGTPPSPALAAPFRLLSAAGIAAAERASPKFLADLARHPAVIDAVSALTGTCMVPAPCGTRAAAGAVDLVLSLSDTGAWAAGFAMLQHSGIVLRQTGAGPAAYTRLTFLPEDAAHRHPRPGRRCGRPGARADRSGWGTRR